MASRTFKKLTDAEKWNRDRIRIHALKTKVEKTVPGFGEDNYRDLISDVSKARCDSSKDLTAAERFTLIQRLPELAGDDGYKKKSGAKTSYPGRPRNMEVPERQDLLEKIEACLASRSLPWAYAEGMVKRICKKDALEFCGPADLRKIVAAFGYDAKRKGLRK